MPGVMAELKPLYTHVALLRTASEQEILILIQTNTIIVAYNIKK